MKAMKTPSNNALCLDMINENPFTITDSQPEQRWNVCSDESPRSKSNISQNRQLHYKTTVRPPRSRSLGFHFGGCFLESS